jgi:hypothetical protein
MCGSLRLEGQKDFVPRGSPIDSIYLEGSHQDITSYAWDGYARTDGRKDGTKTMAEQWSDKEWRATTVKIEQFTEYCKDTGKLHNFNASRIGAIINKRGQLKILTRPAKTQQEVAIHHRMPSRLPKDMSLQDYTQALNKVTGGDYKPAE